MPADIAQRSRVTAIELDRISGRILRSLYGACGVDVRIGGFEAATLAEGTYDLILSNVPFGRYGVLDNRNRPYSRASIHNWFVGRALDVLRPGGLVCFITSTYFLDESDAGMRAHVASEADLVTAFRLPSGTFERIASTSVQADLVVFRKRAPGEAAAAAEWLDLDYVPKTMLREGCHEQYLRINRWFVRHPEHVLGRIDRVSNGFQAVPTAMLDGDLESALLGAQALVPKGAYSVQPKAPARSAGTSCRHPLARGRDRSWSAKAASASWRAITSWTCTTASTPRSGNESPAWWTSAIGLARCSAHSWAPRRIRR
jgi:hypothetical protein